MYVNPIPYIDEGKEFEMRLRVVFDDVVEISEGKRKAAEYIKNTPVEKLVKTFSCTDIKAVYPKEV
ncbi:MAG: hypothetical protein HFH69_12575 [Lachnospiraceae bacterium]|nr:hypothetical protein [Lachnospiraceae bacterium]